MGRKTKNPVNKTTEKSTGAGRDSLVQLRADVEAIEVRLKRANSLTKSSVTSLKKAFNALSERNGGDASQAAEPIEQLSERLTGLIEKTRCDVAHDLQVVMTDPRLETLGAALTKANRRLSTAEAEQARAIAQINEQIATLATAIDERLRREVEVRESQHAALDKRVSDVETGGAAAIEQVGEKVVAFSDDLTKRTEAALEDLKQSANAHMLEKEKSFEDFKFDLDRRVEALEDSQRNTVPSIERRLVTMASRIEVFEDGVSAVSANTTQAPPAAVYAAPPMEPVSEPTPNVQIQDAFSPQDQTPSVQVPPPAPLETNIETETNRFTPQEFVPAQAPGFAQDNPYAAPEAVENPYAQALNAPNPSALADPYASNVFPQEPFPLDTVVPPMPNAMLAPAVPTYDLPPETMDSVRPGVETKGKSKKKRGGSSMSRPIKMAALMAGVAVIGLMAGKTVLPKLIGGDTQTQVAAAQNQDLFAVESSEDLSQITTVSDDGMQDTLSVESDTPNPVTLEPVGDYSQVMTAPETGGNTLTLEAAAKGGNAIAQFHLGLSHLEAEESTEAVRLIRFSANQNQPAAQYRLAKLYEAGVGVEPDVDTAMALLRQAADNGNRIAMHDLGHYFAQGTASTPQDINKAAEWFIKAAERGVLDSQFNLGVLHYQGSGVPKSIVDAYVWFSVAGAQGDQLAASRAEALVAEMSARELEQAKTRVKAFAPKRINEPANGIFRQLPWSMPAKNTSQNGPNVKTAQTMLMKLGYDVGRPDGAMGPKTRNAVIQFERANGLPETGRVNAALMERLSFAAGV